MTAVAAARPAAAAPTISPVGTVYLLAVVDPATGEHFRPGGEPVGYHHARHYIGFSADGCLSQRLADQLSGSANAANLVRVVLRAGLGWRLVAIWKGVTRSFERLLKNLKGAWRCCPVCLARPGRVRAFRPRRIPAGQRPPWLLLTPPARPTRTDMATFLQLNPAFARPVRASVLQQWARVADREEWAALSERVLIARARENQALSQHRVTAVVDAAKDARRERRRRRAAARAERQRLHRLAATHTTRAPRKKAIR